MKDRAGSLLIAAWTAVVSGVLVGVAAAFRHAVPDPMATHWGLTGDPDGSMPFAGFVLVNLALWLVIAGWTFALAVRRGLRWRRRRASAGAVLAGGAVFVVGMESLGISANLGVTDWRQAATVNWQLVPVFAACGLAGWLGRRLAGRGPDEEPDPTAGGVTMRLTARARTVWVSSVSSRVLTAVAAVALVVGETAAATGVLRGSAVIVFAVVGVACVALRSMRVQVTEDGVLIAFGPLRRPVRRIPLERITGARSESRSAWESGGWGYRVRPGVTAVMLRGGDCLVLRLNSGRDFVISVDDAESGAKLVNALLEERSAVGEV